MVDVRFTPGFKRRLKFLRKRYPQIQTDIQPLLEDLQVGNIVGDQIPGIQETVFKARARNSNIPVGKSGGYRIIYQLISSERVLLLIYAKSDQVDISVEEIKKAIRQATQE